MVGAGFPALASPRRNQGMLKPAAGLGFRIEARPEDDGIKKVSRML